MRKRGEEEVVNLEVFGEPSNPRFTTKVHHT
jgi:hypothetical protein